MPQVFISYRREDSQVESRLIHQVLKTRLGADSVFLDVTVPHGQDFVDAITERLESCTHVIVVLGPRWLDVEDEHGKRRLDDPEDWVRVEIATALQNEKIQILPLRLDGATMPRKAGLPPELQDLHRKQAIDVRVNRIEHDLEPLIRTLERGSRARPWLRIGVGVLAIVLAAAWAYTLWSNGDAGPETNGDDPVVVDEDEEDPELAALLPVPHDDDHVPMPSGEMLTKAFAGYPEVSLREEPDSGRVVRRLLWGDYVLRLGPEQGEWVRVWARYRTGWVRARELQLDRLLEIYFLDAGSDSGCLIVTPDQKILVVDAADGDLMHQLLRWRFGDSPLSIETAVITHPDSDRYRGFQPILEDEDISVGALFHNGIVERSFPERGGLGTVTKIDGTRWLTDLVESQDELKSLVTNDEVVGGRLFARLMRLALDNPRVGPIRMLSSGEGWLPGYGADAGTSIRVLAPVVETLPDGGSGLRTFSRDSETKNGHAIVLRLVHGDVSILLAGDGSASPQDYLVDHYEGVDGGAAVFRSDVARIRQRTRGNLSERYLRHIQSLVTVVTPSIAPTPESMTMIQNAGREGSTVLGQTSNLAKAAIKPFAERVKEFEKRRQSAEGDELVAAVEGHYRYHCDQLRDALVRIGVVTLRTDGMNLLLAERPAVERTSRWQLYRLERSSDGELELIQR